MEEEKLCPMLSIVAVLSRVGVPAICRKEKCTWYVQELNTCAVKAIGWALVNIRKHEK